MQKWLYAINWSCQISGYLSEFIQLDIFLDKNKDIFLLYNHYPKLSKL